MTRLPYTARRAAPEVDIWNLFHGSLDIGILTRFPGEGPMATVRFMDEKRTVSAATLHECLHDARRAHEQMEAEYYDQPYEPYFEDEDGSIAHMRMLERQAESAWMRHGYDQEPY